MWARSYANLYTMAKARAVFLDRDGTLNVDPGYINHPDQMILLPGVGAALASLKKAGFWLIVVSNQSGVGRGIIKAEDLPKIHARLDELLAPSRVKIDQYQFCVHRPEEGCRCRKPGIKLLEDAARAYDLDLHRSYMVGDKVLDLGAGRNAGCAASILVRTGHGAVTEKDLRPGEADYVGDSLAEAAAWILRRETP